MPSTKTLNQSQTIGATEDADLLWIWDNSSAELDKISLGNLFAANQTFALLAGRSGGQTLIGGTAANDDLTLEGTSNATRTTSYVILQPNGGNVGIGTTSPVATLQVGSNRPTTINGSTGGIFTKGDSSGWTFGYHARGSSDTDLGGFGFLGSSDTLTYLYAGDSHSSPIMVWEKTTNRVGIGTTSPSRRLHVAGTILIDGDEGSGIAGTIGLTDVNDATLSTGNGTVKLKGTTARDSAGFIKIYVGATTAWIPYWTNIS